MAGLSPEKKYGDGNFTPTPAAITKSHCILQTIKILLFLERIFVSYFCAKQNPLF